MVTSEPSAVRTWVTVTFATGASEAIVLAGAAVAVRAGCAVRAGAAETGRVGDGTAAGVVVDDALQAAVTHRAATAPAARIHPCLGPRCITSSCPASMKQT
jgi:hypothetical protein